MHFYNLIWLKIWLYETYKWGLQNKYWEPYWYIFGWYDIVSTYGMHPVQAFDTLFSLLAMVPFEIEQYRLVVGGKRCFHSVQNGVEWYDL